MLHETPLFLHWKSHRFPTVNSDVGAAPKACADYILATQGGDRGKSKLESHWFLLRNLGGSWFGT